MGSSLFGGGGTTDNSSNISNLNSLSNLQTGVAENMYGVGNYLQTPAYGQYVSGVTGQLTPAEQALVDQNLGAMNTATSGTYSNLGLGGSTMEGQDLNANALKSTAQQANLNFANENYGLQGLQQALNYYTGTEQGLSGAATSQYQAGSLTAENLKALNSAISSLGNKSSSSLSGGLAGLLGGGLGSLFGSGAATTGTGTALDTLLIA